MSQASNIIVADPPLSFEEIVRNIFFQNDKVMLGGQHEYNVPLKTEREVPYWSGMK